MAYSKRFVSPRIGLNVTRFIGKRLLLMIPILLGVTVVVFLTLKMIPGNPVDSLLGIDAPKSTQVALTKELGLNRPLPVQYVKWLWSLLQGNFGTSISQQVPVRGLLFAAFANTLLLAVAALVIAVMVGMTLGALGALRQGRLVGRITAVVSMIAVSTPQYSIALILLVVLSVDYTLFPSGGIHASTGSGGLGDLLRHLALPAVSASLVPTGVVARMFRASLIDVMHQDFVESLRARGLSRFAVIRHAVHNTLPSLLTVTGLQIGYLLGGVVFVETIFQWPGMGLLVYNAISARDYPVIQAGVLVAATSFVAVNALVDTAHAFLDPRVRH